MTGYTIQSKPGSPLPETKTRAYCCTCPDCNPLIFSDETVIIQPIRFIVPSTTCRSNQATGRLTRLNNDPFGNKQVNFINIKLVVNGLVKSDPSDSDNSVGNLAFFLYKANASRIPISPMITEGMAMFRCISDSKGILSEETKFPKWNESCKS